MNLLRALAGKIDLLACSIRTKSWIPVGTLGGTNSTDIPEGIKIAVEKQTTLKITGSDKQQVGSVASKLKTFRKIEPYKGKGIREKGQYVLKKEGKKK